VPERIRDSRVAEEIAAQAGTDQTPELELSDLLVPVIFGPQRPPLAASGYFSGTLGITSPAVALNTSHIGCFGSGVGRAMVRVNWIKIFNDQSTTFTYTLRRLDAPFTGWPSVRAVPAYINAGNPSTGRVFSITKNDTVGPQGVLMAQVMVHADAELEIPGPWLLNDGALVIAQTQVQQEMRGAFGWEAWEAIRIQPPG